MASNNQLNRWGRNIAAPEFIPSRAPIAIPDKQVSRSSASPQPPARNIVANQSSSSSTSSRPRKHQSSQRKEADKEDKRKSVTSQVPSDSMAFDVSLNHLLNFTFPERQRVTSSTVSPRRKRSSGVTVYNKERFVNANFRFVMRDSGDYTVNLFDPDILVEWKDVVQVVIPTPHSPTCPICLSPPAPAKVTRCGHVFCHACVLHYLALGDRKWRKCPICYDAIYSRDLRSVRFDEVSEVKAGSISEGFGLRVVLMKRMANSTVALPRVQYKVWLDEGDASSPPNVYDAPRAAKLVASPAGFERKLLEGERDELMALSLAAQDTEEGIYIDLARTEVDAALADLEAVSNAPDRRGRGSKKGKGSTVSPSRGGGSDAVNNNNSRSEQPLSSNGEESSVTPSFVLSAMSEYYNTAPIPIPINATEGVVGATGSISPEAPSVQTPTPPTPGSSRDPLPAQPPRDNAYYFYQSADGAHVYLHPLDIKILLREHGEYSNFPEYLEVGVLSVRESTVDDDLRKRCKYLAHLPLSCDVTFCEVDLAKAVSQLVLNQFAKELSERNRRLNAIKRAELATDSNSRRQHQHHRSSPPEDSALMPALRRVSPSDLERYIPTGDEWGLPPGRELGDEDLNTGRAESPSPTFSNSNNISTTPPFEGVSFARMATTNSTATWVRKPPASNPNNQPQKYSNNSTDDEDYFAESWTLDLESAVLDGKSGGSNSSMNGGGSGNGNGGGGQKNKKKKSKGVLLVSNGGARGR
ncbi:hypothetical protein SmJEL517_g00428 [Synchytrium microbalum]|uniref:RING-type domain-containing protein n=1 Tax=Synchytrium microbalum TaxID=1806994 RepID=A0A507CDL3_9FUNG|nr:uncharacterized protein SmJEL517_g00428 [Synchytrium microbalum]TPX37428.1 hypothetical protein SmJEL517_g00428 [Synchytrium microbalum]